MYLSGIQHSLFDRILLYSACNQRLTKPIQLEVFKQKPQYLKVLFKIDCQPLIVRAGHFVYD